MEYQFRRADFLNPEDGGAFSTEQRIREVLALLTNSGDFLNVDGVLCHNEEELRTTLGL